MQLFGTKVQKFLHCSRTKGQRDKFKILPQAGTDRDSLSKSGTGPRTGQSLFFSMISCFRTSFPVLKRPFSILEILSCFRMSFSCLRMSFSCFLVFWKSDFCPGIFAPALVSGQRDNKTRKYFCPRTSHPLETQLDTLKGYYFQHHVKSKENNSLIHRFNFGVKKIKRAFMLIKEVREHMFGHFLSNC